MIQSIAWVDRNGNVSEDTDAVWPIYSVTKTFIAATIIAMEIDVQGRISKWIAPAVCPRAGDITVEQLLNHTSGLRDYGGLPAYINAVNTLQPPWSDSEFAEQTLRQPLLFGPGTGWSYSNAGYWLLSQIAQRESGLDFDGVIGRYILQPLGLRQTSVAHGIFSAALPGYPAEWVWHGLLIASACDVARFIASDLVLPLTRQLTKVPGAQPLWKAPHYGYGLMVEPGVRYGHNGGGPKYNAACFKFIARGLTGCVLMESNQDNAAFRQLLALAETNGED
jgi:D-alanyl-D-alanine carboxypeptidase